MDTDIDIDLDIFFYLDGYKLTTKVPERNSGTQVRKDGL